MNGAAILLVFLEGFLAFVSPCILPMLPVYFLYLSGESTAEDKFPAASAETESVNTASADAESVNTESSEAATANNRKSKPGQKRLFINTIFFVIGFTLVFLMLGATSTALGQTLSSHRVLLEKISGAIIILLGIHMTGLVNIPFLNRDHRVDLGKRKVSLLSSMLLGIAFSFGWSPCLGPFLGSALLLSGQSSTLLEGITLLFFFALGLAIPFILASILFEELTFVFIWFKKHMKVVRIVSGSLLVVLGLLMLIGWFGYYANLLI